MKIFNAKEIRGTERVVFAEDAIKEIRGIRQDERKRIKDIILKHFDGKVHIYLGKTIDLIKEIDKESTHTQQEKYRQSLDNKGLPTTDGDVLSNAASEDGESPVENNTPQQNDRKILLGITNNPLHDDCHNTGESSSLTAQEIVDYITKDIENKMKEKEQ